MSPNKYFGATVTSSALILVGLAVMLVKSTPALYQEVLAICGFSWQTCGAVMNTVNPLTVILAAIFMWLTVVVVWQLLKTVLVVTQLTRRVWPTPKFLLQASLQSGIGSRISVIDGATIFCAGLIRPRVYVGRDLLHLLTNDELKAALAHEAYHLRERDPLKIWLATSLAKGLWFLPIINLMSRRYLYLKELAADELALQQVSPKHLSKALYKVLSSSADQAGAVASFTSVRTAVAAPLVQVSLYWILAISIIALSFIASGLVHSVSATGVGC